jgi:hypothetical protein
MIFSFEGGSHLTFAFAHACAQSLLIHALAHRSLGICDAMLQLLAAMRRLLEPLEAKTVSYSGTATADSISASIRDFPTSPGEI